MAAAICDVDNGARMQRVGGEEARDDETLVVGSLDSYLSWPTALADPWGRRSALEQDCVCVVEFSEVDGPRARLLQPTSPGAHFDAADFALWLMTADYQQSGRGGFVLADDMQALMVHEALGVHAYAHYFTLFDARARGFVRPFCLAYVTADAHKLPPLFERLCADVDALLAPVKQCNRRHFKDQLAQTLEALDTVENRAISSYYELYYDNRSAAVSQVATDGARGRTSSATEAARRLYLEVHNAYRVIQRAPQLSAFTCNTPTADLTGWISNRLIRWSSVSAEKIAPMDEMCVCAYGGFVASCRQLWLDYRFLSSMDRFLLPRARGGPILQLDKFPLLQLAADGVAAARVSVKTSPADDEAEEATGFAAGFAASQTDEEAPRLLCSLLPSLSQLLFPLLTGQFMLVCGSELRRDTTERLVRALRRFVACAPPSAARLCRPWHGGRVPASAFAEQKLFGLHVARADSVDRLVASNVRPFVSLLDLNADVFHSARYSGRCIEPLARKNARLFANDRALLAYVYALLAEYGQLAYLSYYFVYCNHETYRKHVRHLKRFAEMLALRNGDIKIMRYFAELLKQQQCEQPRLEGTFESLFLEHEPAVYPIRL